MNTVKLTSADDGGWPRRSTV